MDAIRSILVHQDAGRHSLRRLVLARTLAAQHEARLRALFAVAPRVPGSLPPPPADEAVDASHRREARARFERAASGAGWPMEWRELAGGPPAAGFAREALHADLLVLGQRDPHDIDAMDLPADFVEAVLAASGKPALVVPHVEQAPFEGFGCVLVAWQPSREAALAMSAALPLLQRAREVHLASLGEDAARGQEDVLEHLRLHAVDGVQAHAGPAPADAGEALLALAGGLGADLLVMGCYGHGRARELVLGGASRTVLHEMQIPVLMAH